LTKKYRSKISEAIHETASDLYDIGLIDKRTMRRFDKSCLTEVNPLTPEQIAEIRRRENVSQRVFAIHLNVSLNLISQWERGEKKPSGASLKLLTLVKEKGLDAIA